MDGIAFSAADLRALAERAESTAAATTIESSPGLPWSEAEVALLRKLYAEGKRPRELMAHIGRARQAIEKHIRKLGLNRPDGVPVVRQAAWAMAEKTEAAAKSDARKACRMHLIDLRREFGVAPNQPHWIAVNRYRARCEWDNPPCSNTPLVSNPSRFRGSAEGSQAAMCADA